MRVARILALVGVVLLLGALAYAGNRLGTTVRDRPAASTRPPGNPAEAAAVWLEEYSESAALDVRCTVGGTPGMFRFVTNAWYEWYLAGDSDRIATADALEAELRVQGYDVLARVDDERLTRPGYNGADLSYISALSPQLLRLDAWIGEIALPAECAEDVLTESFVLPPDRNVFAWIKHEEQG